MVGSGLSFAMRSVDLRRSGLVTRRGSGVLLIPFEDDSARGEVDAAWPDASVDVSGKSDFAGVRTIDLLRRFRQQRYDVVVASLKGQTAQRPFMMVVGLLLACRARHRVLRTSDGQWYRFGWWYGISSFLPRLMMAGLLGLLVISVSEFLLWLDMPVRRRRAAGRHGDRKTVLMVRPDLAGRVSAGGSVSHVRGIIDAFRRRGMRVVYLADSRSSAMPADVEQVVITPMALLDAVDELSMVAFDLQVLWTARRLLRELRPDLIYQRHALHHTASVRMARAHGIPSVLEVNASEVWIRSNWSRLWLAGHARRAERWVFDRATTISAVSQGVRDQILALGAPSTSIVVAPNGVDPAEFHPGIDGRPVLDRYGIHNRTVVGFIGTFTRWHGVEILRDAIITCAEQKDLHFLLVGDGDLRASVERTLLERGLGGRVTFTGLVPHAQAPGYLAACDILVSPHLGFTDGQPFFGSPTKLFEYMAMGKPIVATALGQLTEVLHHEVHALMVPPGDSGALTAALQRLADDAELRRRLGAAARDRVVREFTWDQNVHRVLESVDQQSSAPDGPTHP